MCDGKISSTRFKIDFVGTSIAKAAFLPYNNYELQLTPILSSRQYGMIHTPKVVV